MIAQISAIVDVTGLYFSVLLIEPATHLSLAEITNQHTSRDGGECNLRVSYVLLT